MPSQIVSPNYLDRDSEYRWLIREEGKPVKSARAFKRVVCDEPVAFRAAGEEVGFGCGIVAETVNAVGYDEQVVAVPLVFDVIRFKHNGKEVPRVSSLELTEDGRMLAVLPQEPTDDD